MTEQPYFDGGTGQFGLLGLPAFFLCAPAQLIAWGTQMNQDSQDDKFARWQPDSYNFD